MNINLISPEDKGSDFTTYFKEPLTIPENSKVYLNHTALSRHTDIELNDDTPFSIHCATEAYDATQQTYMNILPCVSVADGTTLNDAFGELEDPEENSFIIPKGKYTVYQIWYVIRNGIDQLMLQLTNRPFEQYRFIQPRDMKRVNDWKGNNADVNQENTRFSLGLVWDIVGSVGQGAKPFTPDAFDIDAGNFINGNNTDPGDGQDYDGAYFKTSADNASADGSRLNFDNYALGDKAYHFLGTNDDFTPIINKNIVSFKTSQTYQEIVDTDNCLVCGLYGKQYAQGIYGADGAFPQDSPARTRGTGAVNGLSKNPQQLPQDYTDNVSERFFHSFVQVRIDGRGVGGDVEMRVDVANKQLMVGDIPNTWNCQNHPITVMTTLQNSQINLRHAMGDDANDKIKLGFQTYYDYGEEWNKSPRDAGNKMTRLPYIYFRVLNMGGLLNQSIAENPSSVIYDSKIDNWYFPEDFFVADQSGTPANDSIDYTRNSAVSVRSQVGLYPIVSCLKQGTGFDLITYPQLDDDEFIMSRYRFETAPELRDYLNFNRFEYDAEDHSIELPYNSLGQSGFSRWLYPNHFDPTSKDLSHIEEITLDWKNDSYSILINGIPINNFKNTKDANRGGYTKAILANIPTPFSSSTDFDISNSTLTTAVYEPNFKSHSNLYNQAFTTNNINIQIIKQKTDKPATDILRTIVNFTIEPPDDYKGNLNTSQGM